MSVTDINAHRDVCRLIDVVLNVAVYGGMYSPTETKAVGEYLKDQARNVQCEHERKVLNAMADYFIANSQMDENGVIVART